MTTKHTPGPWATDKNDHDVPYQDIKIKAGKRHTVCTIWIDDAPVRDFNAAQHANAGLIAAAPELLEALQEMLDVWEHGGLKSYPIGKVRAAINKATGATE